MGLINCGLCKGLGILPERPGAEPPRDIRMLRTVQCPSCGGSGKRPAYPEIYEEPPTPTYTEAQIHKAWMRAKSPISLQSLLVALRNLPE